MGTPVSLDSSLVKSAKSHSLSQSRSVPKQIEHWAKIGRIAEENPELSYRVIREILIGLKDAETGNVEEYNSDSL